MIPLSILSLISLLTLLGTINDNVGVVVVVVDAFSIVPQHFHQRTTTKTLSPILVERPSAPLLIVYSTNPRQRSRVSDPSGPSPVIENPPPDVVDINDIPEAFYDENKHPIPHQPWRRGETAGCEAPIDADWRREAERQIKFAVNSVGGTYIDTTWYLTWMDVTIGEDFQDNPLLTTLFRGDGPQINVIRSRFSFLEEDKDNDAWGEEGESEEPKPLWADEDEHHVFFERDLEGEASRANRTYAPADKMEGETDDELPVNPLDKEVSRFVEKEYREDMALRVTNLKAERDAMLDDEWHPLQEWDEKKDEYINTGGLSVIADSILKALEDVEDDLKILARHQLVLSAPTGKKYLDTQKKFDHARGKRVKVSTDDPWKSNRNLYGVLVDRNTLDVYINQKGNLVTIPNNFVAGVELMEDFQEIPDEEGEYEDEDEEYKVKTQSEYDEEDYEEEEYAEDEENYDEDEEEDYDDEEEEEDDE
jgi:ribosome maturation factor RimP